MSEKEVEIVPDVLRNIKDASYLNRKKDMEEMGKGKMQTKEEFNATRIAKRKRAVEDKKKIIEKARKEALGIAKP